ncbi:MAG: hypothetical protein ABQ298_02450 [Puniceicoccaceae bacterium]
MPNESLFLQNKTDNCCFFAMYVAVGLFFIFRQILLKPKISLVNATLAPIEYKCFSVDEYDFRESLVGEGLLLPGEKFIYKSNKFLLTSPKFTIQARPRIPELNLDIGSTKWMAEFSKGKDESLNSFPSSRSISQSPNYSGNFQYVFLDSLVKETEAIQWDTADESEIESVLSICKLRGERIAQNVHMRVVSAAPYASSYSLIYSNESESSTNWKLEGWWSVDPDNQERTISRRIESYSDFHALITFNPNDDELFRAIHDIYDSASVRNLAEYVWGEGEVDTIVSNKVMDLNLGSDFNSGLSLSSPENYESPFYRFNHVRWTEEGRVFTYIIHDEKFPELALSYSDIDSGGINIVQNLVRKKSSELVQEATLTVFNVTPFRVDYAVSYPVTDDEWVTTNFMSVEAGKTAKVTRLFKNSNPDFYLTARSSVYEQRKVNTFHGLSDYDTERQYWEGGAVFSPISVRCFNEKLGYWGNDEDIYGFHKSNVDFARNHQNEFLFVISPFGNNENPQEVYKSKDDLEKACFDAISLSSSLSHVISMKDRYGNLQIFPYDLGLRFAKDDRYWDLGIEITDASTHLSSGEPSPFSEGDVLLSFDGHPIFNEYDVSYLLIEHAQDMEYGGIKVAIPFTVSRGSRLVSGHTNYWFVKEFYDRYKRDRPSQFWTPLWSLGDASFLGRSPEITAIGKVALPFAYNLFEFAASKIGNYEPHEIPIPDYEEQLWIEEQWKAMRQQWYPNTYLAGEFGGLFINLPRGALKVAGGKSMTRFAKSRFGGIFLEVSENVIWTISDGSSVRTNKQMIDEVIDTLPYAVGGAVIAGELGRTTKFK